MFGEKKNVIATYSKKRPVQYTKAIHFLTPDTLEDTWKPYSDDKSLNQVATNTKGKCGILLSLIELATAILI